MAARQRGNCLISVLANTDLELAVSANWGLDGIPARHLSDIFSAASSRLTSCAQLTTDEVAQVLAAEDLTCN